MRNEVLLFRAKEERNVLPTIKRRKVNWIGHILRRNCLETHVIKGKIEVTGRRGRRLRSCRMTLMKLEYTEIPKRKHSIALCRELSFKGDKDLSSGKLRNECYE